MGYGDDESDKSRDKSGEDRDSRAMAMLTHRGKNTLSRAPVQPSGGPAQGRVDAWGGGLRRVQVGQASPNAHDANRYVAASGRYVPIGFARYVPPVVDPNDYEYYRVAGWRVAVPRVTPGPRVRDLLYRIYYYGPQSAGYVRIGDTLVPAIEETGDRYTLAETAVSFEPYPLSP